MSAPHAVLLDTCAVIFVANGDPIAPKARARILRAARAGAVLVSPVSAWEVGLLGRPGRKAPLSFLPDPKTWFQRLMAQPGVREAALSPDVAIDSSFLPPPIHADPADRLLIATARSLGVPIVTRDRLIAAYARAGHVEMVAC
jgi:PIN domain nuclease of toxin-antitoxin system